MLLNQQPWAQFMAFPIFFDVAEVFQQHLLEESRQGLENVDRTHLVLASGKLVPLQKLLPALLMMLVYHQEDIKKILGTFSNGKNYWDRNNM